MFDFILFIDLDDKKRDKLIGVIFNQLKSLLPKIEEENDSSK